MVNQGLFVGLVTLDLVYLTSEFPKNNEKVVAADYTVAAGGPATNAAVTFQYLGNQATLLGVVGQHPITELIRADLGSHRVALTDLNSSRTDPPPVSSIIVTASTGERAVISLNARHAQADPGSIPPHILQGVQIVLIDGHQMEVGLAIAQQAKAAHIPVVIDGGSWKVGFEQVLPFVDYAICSANFYPPGCQDRADVLAYLSSYGVPQIAITQGERPIQYCTGEHLGEVQIKPVPVVDTLGAGDIFHGAFCHYILQTRFPEALAQASLVAADSCQSFGTRHWMQVKREITPYN